MTGQNKNGRRKLFSEFEGSTYEEWKAAAEALLKGAPFEKKMITRTVEGIDLQPIYRREDVSGLEHTRIPPGLPGSAYGGRLTGYKESSWSFAQELPQGLPETFNRALLEGLQGGQNAVFLTLDQASSTFRDPAESEAGEVAACGLSLSCLEDFKVALGEVLPEAVRFYMQPGYAGLPVALFFAEWLEEAGADPERVKGAIEADPLASWNTYGYYVGSLDQHYDLLHRLIGFCRERLPGMKALGSSGFPVHQAGGCAVTELAVVIAKAVCYLEALAARGEPVEAIARSMVFHFSVGGHFFMETAKLRAARLMWNRVLESYGCEKAAPDLEIHARTGLFNKTRKDPYVNLLRTTTEALAGVLAGVDVLTVGSFDECLREPDGFSRRISRNTHIILGEECEMRRTIDPAGGSWYLESLTDELAREGWSRFQEIMGMGGYVEAFRGGKIRDFCEGARKENLKWVQQRRKSLVGTNVYANLKEKPLPAKWPDYAGLLEERKRQMAARSDTVGEPDFSSLAAVGSAIRGGLTLGRMRKGFGLGDTPQERVEPLPSRRLAESYEQLRAASDRYREEHGQGPKLFLANIGPLRLHKARADFTRGFFEAGGFEVDYPRGFESAEAAAEAVVASAAGIAVVCGSDEQYIDHFEAFARAIKGRAPEVLVILAGHPGESEGSYREAGMDDFLWIRSNHYEMNRKYLTALGVLPEEETES